ncbi:MAG: ABC-type multidrug transport system ATPase component, partial [Bacteroidetes bacterium]|nr:ABC-type multidrug transport system ATPase component [Bacteroidota bacterium]
KILQSLIHQGITIIMTTPYLDEAERCTRVALMNYGSIMHVAPPAELKMLMKGTVVEIACDRVRDGFRLLRNSRPDVEVQAFGDRLNVLVQDGGRDVTAITQLLAAAGIRVISTRIVPPTLENVFISLLTHTEGAS